MKITLIEPSTGEKKITSFKYPPMGLLALGGYLKKKGYEVSLIDASIDSLSVREVVDRVGDSEIAGISSMSVNINSAFHIAQALKLKNNKIQVILGGIHPTVLPEHALSQECVDLVVMGEGEITFSEILDGRTLDSIDGIAFRQGKRIVINKRRTLIEDLNTLPIPFYSLLDISKYKSPYAKRAPFISMVRSRGCPFECTFCGNPKMFGRTFRCQSAERTIAEIDYLIKEFGIKEISFKDTELTLDRNLDRLCDKMIDRNYDLIWSCNGRVNNVHEDLLKKMRKAGCYAITFGIESGNPEILKLMKKQITLEQTYAGIKIAKKAGMQVVTNFMIGNAWDTKETIEQTISFAKKLNPDYAYFGFATPFPGTELRLQAEQNHWIINDSMDAIRYDDCMMNATNMPLEKLRQYLDKAYKSFYFRPGFILKKAFNFNEYSNYWQGLRAILHK